MAKSIGTLKASLILDTNQWLGGFAKAQNITKGFTGSIGSSVLGAAKSYGAMATAAISGALSIQSLGKSFTEVDRQAKLADRLGITVGEVQELSLAADLAGTDVEVLAKSMLKMGKNIGSDGIPLHKRLFQVADAIAKITDPAKRAAQAEKIFGKGGLELINVLIQGGKGIRDSAEAIDRFGLAVSRVDAAKIEAANDAWTETKTVLAGLRNQIAVELAPTVTNFLQDWLAGLELIRNRTEDVGKAMPGGGAGNTFSDYIGALVAAGTSVNPLTGEMSSFSDILEGLRQQRLDREKNKRQAAALPLDVPKFDSPSKEKHKREDKQSALERGSAEAAAKISELRGDPTTKLTEKMSEAVEQLKGIRANTKGKQRLAVAKI